MHVKLLTFAKLYIFFEKKNKIRKKIKKDSKIIIYYYLRECNNILLPHISRFF